MTTHTATDASIVFSVRSWEGEYSTHDIAHGVAQSAHTDALYVVNADGTGLREVKVAVANPYAAAFAPEFKIVDGGTTTVVSDPAQFTAKRGYIDAAYGHGMGFKGVKDAEGFVLKDVLMKAGAEPQESGAELVVVSANDSYRAAFSLAEIINRNDNADFLVVDKGHEEDGRFALLSATDFFVDRNVRSVAKIEILKI